MQTLKRGHHALRQHCRLLDNSDLVVGDVLVSHQLQTARGVKLFEVSACNHQLLDRQPP